MGITANTRNTFYSKVEREQLVAALLSVCKSSGFQEGNNETAETAIDMKTDIILGGELTESGDVILVTIWEVDC